MADRYLLNNITVATYYFDGSDAVATDTDGVWTNDANAFDGNEATEATSTAFDPGLFLKAEGTNAPASGADITLVRARLKSKGVASSLAQIDASIYSDGEAQLLGLPVNSNNASLTWSSYLTLSTPTGGWTWAKVQALEVKVNSDGFGTITTTPGVSRVEIEVTSSPATTDGYLLEDGSGVLLLDEGTKQTAFRLYEDGTESGSVAIATENTNIVRSVITDSTVQLRVRIQNTAGLLSTDNYQLEYSKNLGAYEKAGFFTSADFYFAEVVSPSYGIGATRAQSFIGNGQTLKGARFPMKKIATTGSGIIEAVLFAHTGTFGSSTATPTGTELARSASYNLADLVSSSDTPDGLDTFFKFNDNFVLQNGVEYFIGVENVSGDSSISISTGSLGASIPPGNVAERPTVGGIWTGSSRDLAFSVYTSGASVDTLETYRQAETISTTNRLTAGSGSFVAGKLSIDGEINNLLITDGNYTELVYSLILKSALLNHNDTLDFRVTRNNTVLDGYIVTPRITVEKTAGGSTGQIKIYNGTIFVAKPMKVWNGSAWVVKPVKRWNGTAWVTTPY